MTGASDWTGKTGAGWAQLWQKTDRSFTGLTDKLLERTRGMKFSSVLDVGCGAGELSLAVARGRGSALVHGIDLSPDLVAVARERGVDLPNVEFTVSDAATWEDPTFEPELVMSRHGVMFFDDPVGAFAHLCREAAPGAQLIFSCFRERAENDWACALDDVAGQTPAAQEPGAPGPFAFGDRDYVESLLVDSGWSEPKLEQVDYAMVAGIGENAVDDARAYFLRIGPAARAIANLSGAEHEAAVERLTRLVRLHEIDGLVSLAASAWIVTARRPG